LINNYLGDKINAKIFNKCCFLGFDKYEVRRILANGSGKKQFDWGLGH